MPGFDPTILRDEEKAGGFEPGTASDDTFELEQLPAYPGTAQPAPAAAIPEQPSPEAEPVAAEAEPDTTSFIPDSAEPIEAAPVEQTPAAEPANMPYNDPLVLDAGLIALLKEDLNKSKERKREEASAEIPERPAARPEPDYTQPAGEEVMVDLSDIEATHPSTYGLGHTDEPKTAATNATASAAEGHRDYDPAEPVKKRRTLPRAALLALLLLLVLGGAFGAYYFLVPKGAKVAHNDSTATGHHAATTPAPAGHSAGKADTSVHGAATHDTAQHTVAASGPRPIPVDTAVIREHTGGVPPATATHSASQHSEKQQHNDKQQSAANPAASHTAKSNTGSSGQHAGTADKQQTAAADKVKPSTDRAGSKERNSAVKQAGTAHQTSAQQEYVIQVYASPSADDAEEWLGTLKKRNISNGFVTSQSVRGQTWYRVRFGSFSTREEAEKRANELGLSNIWVVRTR